MKDSVRPTSKGGAMRDLLFRMYTGPQYILPALLVCLGLALAVGPFAEASFANGQEERTSISKDELEKLCSRPGTTVIKGSLEMAEGEVMEGNVVVIEGDLEMQSGSSIKGDAIVVSGDALLNGQCLIEGDLRVVSGYLYASEKAKVLGETFMHKGNYELKSLDETTGQVRLKEIKDVNRHRLKGWFALGPFDRVDGHTFDLIGAYRRPEGVGGSALDARLRIPTENTHDDFVLWKVDLELPLFEDETLKLKAGAFKWTETEDSWRSGDLENSLIAFATSNDDRDYYEETGGAIALDYRLTDELSVTGGIRSAECRSLDTRSPFTIVQRTDFRENPPIDEGRLTEFRLRLSYDTRFDTYFPADAWYITAGMQSGLDFLGGERTYTMLEAAVRRHQRLSYSDFLDLKFKAAGAVDPLPVQRTYSLGSVGGVRGKDFDSWGVPRGDRLLLANIEYRRRLPTVRYIQSVFSTWWLVAFYDAGALFISKDPDDLGTLISDASDHAGSGTGVGVSGSSFLPYIGMFVAKDLDTDSWRFIVRLNRPF